MSAPLIAVESNRHVIQFNGLALAAGAQITGVSGQLGFRYRILKAKVFFLDNAVPDLRYYVMVGNTPGGSTTGLPEGQSIFSPYSPTTMIRGSQGARVMEPMLVVSEVRTYLKVHVWNADAVFACDWAAEITIERL